MFLTVYGNEVKLLKRYDLFGVELRLADLQSISISILVSANKLETKLILDSVRTAIDSI